MRLFVIVGAVVFVSAIGGNSFALAQDCKCAGAPIDKPYNGGNAQPLKWLYSPYIVNSPPPPQQKLICYFKQVSNKGNSDVRDVRWEVANFFRRIVPRGASPSSCPEVAGDTKPAPTNGPLNYGPSSDAYDTTVLQPMGGWGQSASNSSPSDTRAIAEFKRGADGQIVQERIRIASQLDTVLTFYVDDQQGNPVPARLAINTTDLSSGDKTNIAYNIWNDSEVTLGVLVNLSATPAILDKVPMLQRPLWIKSRDKFSFGVSVEGQKSIEQAAIVIYDEKKNIVAIDSAAFYTVPGKKEVSDQSFWERLR
jgi:hypothetical protein